MKSSLHTIAARLHEESGGGRPVQLTVRQDQLVIMPGAGGEPLFLWRIDDIVERREGNDAVLLFCPPATDYIAVQLTALANSPLARKLPLAASRSSLASGVMWLCFAAVFVTVVCAVFIWGPTLVSPTTERRVFGGVELFSHDERCELAAGGLEARAFQKLLARLYPLYPSDHAEPIQIDFVKRRDVNAAAFLAGRIYVFTGLLHQAQSPEELAGVLAHEIEHIKRHHVLASLSTQGFTILALSLVFPSTSEAGLRQAAGLLNLTFTRKQEFEADLGAFRRLRDARISTLGIIDFFDRFATQPNPPTFLSDHPAEKERAELAAAYLVKDPQPIMSDSQFALIKKACQ